MGRIDKKPTFTWSTALRLAIPGCTAVSFDPSAFDPDAVITRDVAIIGGGATGTYAAIALRDMKKSVVVVEAAGLLGGHVNTYVDPATAAVVDYGVVRYQNDPVATKFFDRLGVNYTATFPPTSTKTRVYADFATDQTLDFSPGKNYTSYLEQLQKYPYLVWTNNIPDPAPSDFYLTFGEFITKYSLQNVAYSLYYHFGGSLLDIPVLSVIGEFGLAHFTADNNVNATFRILGGNHQIYAKALGDLGSRVLLNSTVTAASRSSSGIRLVVKTPSGKKLVMAKRLLITIPTIASNMEPFTPDSRERDVFSKFFGRGYWTGLVKIDGLPEGTAYSNAGTATTYHIPAVPAVAMLDPTAVDVVYEYWYFDDVVTSNKVAQKNSMAAIEKFVSGITGKATHPQLVAFSSHSPWRASLTSAAIRDGYWPKMYALQGHRNTWYTGGQFLIGSTQLWNYTQTLIPDIVAGL